MINYRITLDGSTLVDDLIKSSQVDYPSALIPTKAVDNGQAQEHLAAIRHSTRH